MHELTSTRPRTASDDGFTLIELVVTVAIVGIIVVSLTGVVISYLKTSVSTAARLTESHDVQFTAAYWQRDIASIGVRSSTYDRSDTVHSFPLRQSVNITPACSLPSGASYTTSVTLAWSSYTSLDSSAPATTVTVSYVTEPTGAGGSAPYRLVRVRCTGSTLDSDVTVADNLTAAPAVACTGGGVAGCSDASGAVPTTVTMTLTSADPDNHDGSTYSATLLGERRET